MSLIFSPKEHYSTLPIAQSILYHTVIDPTKLPLLICTRFFLSVAGIPKNIAKISGMVKCKKIMRLPLHHSKVQLSIVNFTVSNFDQFLKPDQ